MLFGYAPAAIAGFLLTAVPNWTGRLPVTGAPLAVLSGVWLVGRVGMLLPAGGYAWLDLVFLPLLGAVIAREVIGGKNWRNLRVLAPLLLLAGANIWFHFTGDTSAPIRLGFSALLLLIMVIGGRIIPSFTRNWLARQAAGRMPVPFGRFDAGVLGVSVAVMFGWTAFGASLWVGAGFGVVAAAHIIRLARWAGYRCGANPLLLVLHIFYAFVPLGFLSFSAAFLLDDPAFQTGGFHLLGIGAIGGLTLAVMLRASLGHSGKPLAADRLNIAMFALIFLAALARFTAAVWPQLPGMLTASGILWIVAFALFTFRVAPMSLRARA